MCHVMFFWKLSYKSMFLLKQACRRCFAENRQLCFLELPGKRTGDVLLERTVERMYDVWKGTSIQQTVDGTVWYWFSLPLFVGFCWCWSSLTVLCGISSPCKSLLVIVCCDFMERNTPKNFWWCSGRLGLMGSFAVSSRSNCCC